MKYIRNIITVLIVCNATIAATSFFGLMGYVAYVTFQGGTDSRTFNLRIWGMFLVLCMSGGAAVVGCIGRSALKEDNT